MTSRLVLELDVDPPEVSPSKTIDYAGRLVSSFTTTPLFVYKKWGAGTIPALLEAAEPRFGGLEWILYPRRTATLDTENQFTVHHLLKMLSPGKKQYMRPSQRFLREELKSIELYGLSSVRLRLRRPMPFLPEILSADAFVSISDQGKDLTSGPYSLTVRRPGQLLVLTKKTASFDFYPDGPETIFFIVTRSPNDGIDLFEQGLIDATCNPNLPSAAMKRYRSSKQLRTGSLAMAGVLIPRNVEDTLPVHLAINRAKICSTVKEGLMPLDNIMDIFYTEGFRRSGTGIITCPFSRDNLHFGARRITIAYADFPPNGRVVKLIAESLMLASDAKVDTKPLSYTEYIYEMERQTYDFVYTLIQPALPEPVVFLEQLLRWKKRALNVTSLAGDILCKPYFDRLDDCRNILESELGDLPLIPVVQHASKFLASDFTQLLYLTPDGLFRPSLHLEGCT